MANSERDLHNLTRPFREATQTGDTRPGEPDQPDEVDLRNFATALFAPDTEETP